MDETTDKYRIEAILQHIRRPSNAIAIERMKIVDALLAIFDGNTTVDQVRLHLRDVLKEISAS